MKLRNFLLCGCILAAAAPAPLCAARLFGPMQRMQTPAGPKIRVLLEKEAPAAYLEAKGPYWVVRKESGAVLSSGSQGKRFVAHAIQDGLRWGEEYPDIYQISIIPLSRDTCFLVNGIQYKGTISIYRVQDNHIAIVNEVLIEDFLKSTLTLNCNSELPEEAMAALIIAARTEAYNKVVQASRGTRPWDITAAEANYLGQGVTRKEAAIESIVDGTRYMVLEEIHTTGLAQNIDLAAARAGELARKGLDAQKILKAACPTAKIGANLQPTPQATR